MLHVLRYRREQLGEVLDAINATGYGLTFGVHSRIDETIAQVTQKVQAGNIYVNRNVIGAVVGVQPFGGMGLSGTGPKAGGPLYLYRLLQAGQSQGNLALAALPAMPVSRTAAPAIGRDPADLPALEGAAKPGRCIARPPICRAGRAGRAAAMPPGPWPRAKPTAPAACWASCSPCPDRPASRTATSCCRAAPSGPRRRPRSAWCTTSRRRWPAATRAGWRRLRPSSAVAQALAALPPEARGFVESRSAAQLLGETHLSAMLFEGDGDALQALLPRVAQRPGALVRIENLTPAQLADGALYDVSALMHEQSISTNTAAAGGNAQLMTMG